MKWSARWGAGRRALASQPADDVVALPRIDSVLVREGGRWHRTPVDEPTIEVLDDADVLAMGAGAGPVRNAQVALPSAVEVVEPAVFVQQDGTVWAAAPTEAGASRLTVDELGVITRVVGPTAVAIVAAEIGDPTTVRAAIAHLLELGVLRSCPPGAPSVAAAPDATEERPDVAAPSPPDVSADSASIRCRPLDPSRIPVLPVHVPRFGPPLALGMIISYARVWHDGVLADTYELRTPVSCDEAAALLADFSGPALVLCSNYVWSLDANLRFAGEFARQHPNVVIVHGGPSTPKNAGDQDTFFERPGVDVAVIGEGEQTAVELLAALADDPSDLSRLRDVDGLVYRDRSTGELVRTPERERLPNLSVLPSPYLVGEFDHLHPDSWDPREGTPVVETNRGCPYKCAFCDWGSATMSRIRKFPLERVLAEQEWLAARGLAVWMVADANFGILPRDVDIARHLVDVHRRTGVPHVWGVNTAKNATVKLAEIISMLCEEGITAVSSLALQTRDPGVLDAINRSNISPGRYDDLAVTFRQRELWIYADLILGLPGSTVETFMADLQWCADHEITPRAWLCQVLPNAPMNDPAYREQFALEIEGDVVVASSTFTRDDRARMLRLRMAERVFEHFGLLRHVLRFLQWDHGLPMVGVLDRLVGVTSSRAPDYPLLAWVQNHFDVFFVVPFSWRAFYDEVERFVTTELGVVDEALGTVLAVQRALMPDRDRSFPDSIDLPHDYVAYHRNATRSLHTDGQPSTPERPLREHLPGTLTVHGDPSRIGQNFRRLWAERPPDRLPGVFWQVLHFELDSPLTRWVGEVASNPDYSAHERPSTGQFVELVTRPERAAVSANP